MKKTVLAALLTSMSLGIFATNVSAVETNATASYIVDTDGDIVKPDEDPEDGMEPPIITIPDGGGSTQGDFRIQYVPHIAFGSEEASLGLVESKANVMLYEEKNKPGVSGYIPHFAQVSDYRTAATKVDGFKLSVKFATPFTAGTEVASGLSIRINNSIATNNVTQAKAGKLSKVADNTSFAYDPAATNQVAVELLATKGADKDVSNSQSSIVFDETYTLGRQYGATEKTAGLTLVKPASMSIAAAAYTAKLEWVLVSGI